MVKGHSGLPTTLATFKVGSGSETVEIGRRFSPDNGKGSAGRV